MTVSRQTVRRIMTIAVVGTVWFAKPTIQAGQGSGPTIATEADFQRAMKDLSNWGRWGEKDELGAANLITPAKRKQAVALAREGVTVSLAHDVPQEKAADTPTILERSLVTVSPGVTLDRYQYDGTYHGVSHS